MTKLFGPFLSFGEWALSMGKDIVSGGKDTRVLWQWRTGLLMADGKAELRWAGLTETTCAGDLTALVEGIMPRT